MGVKFVPRKYLIKEDGIEDKDLFKLFILSYSIRMEKFYVFE